MRTRRDQVQAYRFVTRRIVSALLSGDPETSNLPMRRLGMAVFGSVIAAAVVLGGVGAYGQFTGNTAPLEPNTLVIERETGATYVFVDGQLHPTLNYASARLIINEPAPQVRTMSQASIRDRPRGRTVGIVGAPDALPDRKSLTGLPWSVCDVPDPADPRRSGTRVVIDRPLPGGAPLGDRAVLVEADGQRHLLTGDRRLQVTGGDSALAALRMANAPRLPVGQQLLNAVPAGPVMRQPTIAGEDEASTLTERPAKVGQVFRAAGQHYVLTREGLSAIGEISALLLLRDGGQVTDITPAQAGKLLTDQRAEEAGMPQALPALHPVTAGRTAVCATYRAGTDGGPPTTTLEVFDRVPAELAAPGGVPVRQSARDGVRTAEGVLLPGGKGVLVQATPGSGESGAAAPGATVHLISAQGVRYPLGVGAMSALGYEGVTPLAVPASLLALVPTGPTLSRDDALAHFAPGPAAQAPGPAKPADSPAPARSGASATPSDEPASDAPVSPGASSPGPGTDG
ncbi:type VII secretion protein EccB [Micromonospora sp. DSM 115977]|uniref:Type VII secretion protein EccB n=1 Tax=Micromonospora reichwaldensis TaxID=3075516 RepID=A0ABU2WS75_9ACTN|nr:type VII secretion protein EccB [Micromonospora sp. DSM 115977]MDT0528221.1 type VII secretion protein EccB [Micromonospora sp. DSM 115977]